jgi:hypothetical protein
MSRALLFVLSTTLATFPTLLSAQSPPLSDPKALAFASQSSASLTGGNQIADVTLTGNVIWTGTDTGTATLKAFGTGESRIDLVLSNGTRTEIRDSQTGAAIGEWINSNNVSGAFAFQNCQTDAVWFFPALGSLSAGSNVVLLYVGQETRNGTAVQHIQSYIYQPNLPPVGPTSQQLSAMDFYLDATTLLPMAITFNTHPDNNASTNLAVEVDFSNYQSINGRAVPMHIQRYQQGNLMVDMVLSSAAFNTGLPLSTFTIN